MKYASFKSSNYINYSKTI